MKTAIEGQSGTAKLNQAMLLSNNLPAWTFAPDEGNAGQHRFSHHLSL